jgi:hypothetical protein
MSRVLFYSPYATWGYHTALEATWAHSLKTRGVDVQFVLCNALSNSCDVYRETLNPRQPTGCLSCQSGAANMMSQLSMHYDWLGTFLPPTTREQAEQWVATLANHELLSARWKDMEVGQWAATSAYNQFRAAELDFQDPKVVQIVRDLLVGTVVNLEAMDALLDLHRPDTLVLLNGRFFGHWTAIELAKRKGIRYVAHERGFTEDTVRFAENAKTHELGGMRKLWDEWRDIPLSPQQASEAAQILEDRRAGRNFSRMSFSPPVQQRQLVKNTLGLDQRPLVAIYNSSDDETAAFPDRLRGAFPNSRDFLPAVLELAKARPDVQFVIRVHPNIQKAQAGTNQGALDHAIEIRNQATPNLHVVMPVDDVSSYTLMDMAQVGIVYGSTIGLEMAASGKPVLCMSQSTYSHTGIATQVNRPEELGPALDIALTKSISVEVARKAMRWVYRYFSEYSIPFKLVHGAKNDGPPSLNYSSVAELLEGRDQSLDQICSYLMGQTDSVLPGVGDADRLRARSPETESIALWTQLINSEDLQRSAG